MQKRAQFFLIAAFVIVVLILQLSTVYISTQIRKEDRTVYELSDEIDYEVSQIINNGIFQDADDPTVLGRVKEVMAFYAKTNPESDIVIYYGDKDNLKALVYESATCEPQGLSPPMFSPVITSIVTASGETVTKASEVVVGDTIVFSKPQSAEFPFEEFAKGVNQKSEKDKDKDVSIKVISLEKNTLALELQIGEENFPFTLKEFERVTIVNYEIATYSFSDPSNLKIDAVSVEEIKKTASALVSVNLPDEGLEGIFFSPGVDIERVCFEFETPIPENTAEDDQVEGRKVSEGQASITEGKVQVIIADTTKEFTLSPGENFFVVVKRERDGERTIGTN